MARRSGLGKGLGALIPTEVAGTGARPCGWCPWPASSPTRCSPGPASTRRPCPAWRPRSARSGSSSPSWCGRRASDDYELIAGERRWRAARRAGLQTMPVLVQSVSDVHSLEQALVENLHREDLNALEEAAAFQQLVDEFGYTHEQVASRVGKSRTAVTNTLRLLQLPAGVQRALADGAISAGHARALLGTPDRSFQEELAKRIVAEGLTVRAVEEGVRRHASGAEADGARPRTGATSSPVHRRPTLCQAGPGGPRPVTPPPARPRGARARGPAVQPPQHAGSRSTWAPSGAGWWSNSPRSRTSSGSTS